LFTSVILNEEERSEESYTIDSSLSRLAAFSFCASLSLAQKLRLRKFRAAFFCHRQRRPAILRMTGGTDCHGRRSRPRNDREERGPRNDIVLLCHSERSEESLFRFFVPAALRMTGGDREGKEKSLLSAGFLSLFSSKALYRFPWRCRRLRQTSRANPVLSGASFPRRKCRELCGRYSSL